MSEVVLRAQGLRRRFTGTGTEIDVLDGVDLDVRRGEVVGIVGASGVGKSTLLHILGSLDYPDAGTVTIAGNSTLGLKGARLDRMRNETMGFIFQFHFLLPEFTALENVMMPRMVAGEDPAAATPVAKEWLARVGLADRASHRPGELSGGEQQRVAVARALVNDAQIVFADEPTGNLDEETGDEIHTLIRSLADKDGKAFIVVTHKRSFSQYADRVLLLADRKLVPLEG